MNKIDKYKKIYNLLKELEEEELLNKIEEKIKNILFNNLINNEEEKNMNKKQNERNRDKCDKCGRRDDACYCVC